MKTIHDSVKDFSCHKCLKFFGRKDYLQKYREITHEIAKDFSCEKCTKTFGFKSHLQRHMKTIYLGVKGFTCDMFGNKISCGLYCFY